MNIEYIKEWFLSNNAYIKNNYETLNILILYTLVFEKVNKIKNDDEIYILNNKISFKSGNLFAKDNILDYLKVINYKYGYLDIDDLKNTFIYRNLINYDGLIDDSFLIDNFSDTVLRIMYEYKDYDFNKYIYKLGNKVFFSNCNLNENDLNLLKNYLTDGQILFEVYKDDNHIEVY